MNFRAAAACLLPLLAAASAARAREPDWLKVSTAPAVEPGRPITLDEAFTLALERSETVAESSEAVVQALARVDELKSDIYPHLAVNGTETLQQNPDIGYPVLDQTSVPQFQVQLTQPIFSGFREFIAFKAGKAQARSAAQTEARDKQLLYQDVARAYLNLLLLQRQAMIQRDVIGLTRDRVRQLEDWVRIGRSRESDELAARAQVALNEGNLEITRGQEAMAQESLDFLTGLDERLTPRPLPTPQAPDVAVYLDRAQDRADVEAQRQDYEYDQLFTKLQSRQRWGTIGLTADYYLARIGFYQNSQYDGIFAVNLPIWDFGTITAQTHEAKAAERSGAQALSLAQRQAASDVKTAYQNLRWTLSAVRALDNAADLAARNAEAQSEDYRLGLVTNLDVLDAVNTLQTTRLTLEESDEQAALAGIELEVAAGGPALANE